MQKSSVNILLIDDDAEIRKQIKWVFKKRYKIIESEDEKSAKEILTKKGNINLIILDLFLPPDTTTPSIGFRLLNFIKKNYPEIPVIVITGGEEKDLAIKAVEKGASDFFQKPVNLEELEIVIKRTLYKTQLEQENIYLRQELLEQYNFSNIIYSSSKMKNVIEIVKQVIDADLPVLIEGESGTGKELIARAIHYNSKFRKNRFVAINCSAIPASLLESELFGYVKGAFTGATKNRIGKIEIANNGTLFLDEIGDMPLDMQAKILRVLTDGEVTPIGSNKSKRIKFRLITATNKNLEDMVKNNKFREDLFYRINVIRIKLPPLRERREDIPLLVYHFIKLYNQRNNTNIKGVSKEIMDKLVNYNYKGNVRELENLVYLGCTLCKKEIITEEDLILPDTASLQMREDFIKKGGTLREIVDNFKKQILIDTLNEVGWVYIKAAKKLGLDKYKMRYLVKKYGINKSNSA